MLNEYNEIIREYFDISDKETRKTIVALEDDQQTQLLAALSSALYDKIVAKADKIDFGTIPRSRGDITKVEGFESTLECLNIIRRLVLEYKENPAIVDTVITAINNIRERKAVFMKAFALNVDLPVMLYNTTVLAIEQCVSFMISVCIQYIKDPESKSISSALDKVAYNNTRDNLLYEQLEGFNKSCLSKQIDKVLEEVIKNGGISESSNIDEDTFIINIGKEVEVEAPKHCEDHKDEECKDGNEKCAINEEDPQPEQCPPEEPQCSEVPAAGACCPSCGNEPCTCNQVPVNGGCEEPVEEKSVARNIDLATMHDIYKNSKDAISNVITFGGKISGKVYGIAAIVTIIIVVLKNIRNIIYYCFHAQAKLSDMLDIQAQFLEANVIKLEYSTNGGMTDEEKAKVIAKQRKSIEKLKKWSNFWAIKDKQSAKEASKDLAEDNDQQYTISGGIF